MQLQKLVDLGPRPMTILESTEYGQLRLEYTGSVL